MLEDKYALRTLLASGYRQIQYVTFIHQWETSSYLRWNRLAYHLGVLGSY